MRKHLLALAAVTSALLLGACGSTTEPPGAGPGTSTSESTDPDAPVGSDGSGEDSDGSGDPVDSDDPLGNTTGDSPFYIDDVSVRIAESYPVQLFLEVEGNAPTPGHRVAYTVKVDGDQIDVTITSQSGEGMSAAVLQPHSFVIPLGPAELPVTIDVNDGEFVETVRS